jgi:hypothetical protein
VARAGRGEHFLLDVEARDRRTARGGLNGVGAIARSDIEHALATELPSQVEDDVRLHAFGDLAERRRSPPSVGVRGDHWLGHPYSLV